MRLPPLLLAALVAGTAQADDAGIRTAVKAMKPDAGEITITASALPALREVHVDGLIVYMSPDGRFLVSGDLIDTKTKRNLTTDAKAIDNRKLLASSPSASHIRFAPAKPAYTVYVFTDSSCGYCRKFHSQIADYNKLGIAVEYLAYPRNGLQDASATHLADAWCASDKKQALTSIKNDKPIAHVACKNPVASQYELGHRLGVTGTPSIFAPDGRQLGGYLTPTDLLAALKAGP